MRAAQSFEKSENFQHRGRRKGNVEKKRGESSQNLVLTEFLNFVNPHELPFASISVQPPKFRGFFKDVENALSSARLALDSTKPAFPFPFPFPFRFPSFRSRSSSVADSVTPRVTVTTLLSEREREREALEAQEVARKEQLAGQLAVWSQNPHWVDEQPVIQVTAPPGHFCDLYCSFTVGLPPEAVFDILCNPDNHRKFKNMQAVKSRTVLEDRGAYQRVLVEQTAVWHFLWLSGTFDVHMEVATDRSLRTIAYRLAQGGFMKLFEGNWEIEPLLVKSKQPPPIVPPNPKSNKNRTPHTLLPPPNLVEEIEGPTKVEEIEGPLRMAAKVTLRQRLQPAVSLPPPISGYVRGISASATRSMLADLQEEARRLREGRPVTDVSEDNRARRREPPSIQQEGKAQEHGDHTRKGSSMSSRRRSKNRFRQKLRQG